MTRTLRRSKETGKKRTRHKAELRVINSVHDQLQMESASHFDLLPDGSEQERRYRIDAYLYIPLSIGINSDTYKQDDFFRHLTSHYRIRTPRFPDWLEQDPAGLRLDSAERYFAVHLSTYERRELAPLVEQEVKLFGSFMHTRIKKLLKELRRIPQARNRQEALRHLSQRLEHVVGLVEAFRTAYLKRLRDQPLLIEDEVLRAFLLSDEYISYRLEFALIRLRKGLPDQEGASELLGRAEGLLQEETRYRRAHDRLCLEDAPDQSRRLEHYTYRLGLLKKHLSEALYLRVTSAKQDHLYRNAAAAVGAGLAALFAGLAEQQRLQYLQGSDSGSRLTILIVAAVVAYIFKDRIKDLSKEFFNERLKHRLPDYRFLLAYPYFDRSGQERSVELGLAQEFVRFLKEEQVPPEILYLRAINQHSNTDPARNEVVLHHARQWEFRLRPSGDRSDFRYIKNVLRFDFSEFLAKLDDPSKTVYYYDPKRGARSALAPKVYHVNILFRYETTFGSAEKPHRRRVDVERVRLVLNKRGIVRLEEVVPSGDMAYTEELA